MSSSTPIPSPSLVVLVGPPASGKSTWAAENFGPEQVLGADTLRGIIGEHELDLSATDDAFELLDHMLEMRLGRRLTTVIDTTGLDDGRRAGYLATARSHGVPAVAVRFATSAAECKRRNRARTHPVPAKALDTMLRRFRTIRPLLDDEGWDHVLDPAPVRLVTEQLATATQVRSTEDRSDRTGLRFGLHISDFTWIEDMAQAGPALSELAHRAEQAGFDSLWLMDHLVQIPQVGREWDPMLEPYTTLAHMAASTKRIRVGVMVSPVTMRHVGVLAKLIATLDVLSGGRAVAGVGAGSSASEHELFGIPFGSAGQRLDLLEQTLLALPVIWGAGAKPVEAGTISIDRAVAYPRPLQDPLPIIVGGSGAQRTLKLAARHAHGCNLFGDLKTLERRIGIVREHLEDAGRSATDFEITHLGGALLASDPESLRQLLERVRPSNVGPERFAKRANAGTVADHVEGYRAVHELGVDTAIISTSELGDQATFDTWADLIEQVGQ